MNHWRQLVIAVTMIPIGTFAEPTAASEAITVGPTMTVRLHDGTALRAAIDSKTDASALWLRFDRTTAVLYRPLAWSAVKQIEAGGQVFSVNEVLGQLTEFVSDRQLPLEPPPADRSTSSGNGPNMAEQASAVLNATPRVGSISIDAYAAHWDADTEIDGLAVAVTALDRYGRQVPVRGTLRVEMVADRRTYLKPQLPRRRQDFSRLGSWTRTMQADDGGYGTFLLPFQAVHPEFDAVASSAFVVAELAVPGHGVFHATATDVRIRPISNLRDQLQNSHGRRYLPIERTGRTR